MAQMFPAEPLAGTSNAELKVRRALEQLPDSWSIVHGVAWKSTRNGRPGDGEADFVAIHPARGMLVIEVKGGGIDVDKGRWTSTDRNGDVHPIKNPFEQATASKHALIAFLKSERSLNLNQYVDAGHAVAFPDIATVGNLGPATPSELVWTAQDLEDLQRGVESACEYWEMSTKLGSAKVASIVDRLAPTVHVRPVLREKVGESLDELMRLTDGQVKVLDRLRRTRRAVIYGGAGTGKTVLAVQRARRLADQGFRVLLTCFNQPLGEHLSKTVAGEPLITASSFHSFAVGQLKSAGLPMPADPPSSWWDETLPSGLPDLVERSGKHFDALVVDEGQDFRTDWWTVLSFLLKDPDRSPFYVFADTHQAVYREGWEPPFTDLEFELDTNCRNTEPIARRVAAVFGDDLATLGAPGSDPLIHLVEGFGAIGDQVKSALHRLLSEEGLRPEQVVVLSTSRQVVDVLRQRRIGNHQLVPAGGKGIVAETVHRFKGLEADAIVLIAHEPTRETQTLLYVGLSRARAHLELICTPEVAQLIDWSA